MDFHIMSTYRLPGDQSPVEMVSAELLAHYRKIEAEQMRRHRTRFVRRRGAEDTRVVYFSSQNQTSVDDQ